MSRKSYSYYGSEYFEKTYFDCGAVFLAHINPARLNLKVLWTGHCAAFGIGMKF